MSEPFDPHAAQPPSFPPPGAPGAPMGAPQSEVPAYGAPPPAGVAAINEVPAYGAPPPMGSHGHDQHAQPSNATGVLAGFGSRLGATLLDGFFFSLLSLVALVPLGLILRSRWETELEPCTVNGRPDTCDLPTDASLRLLVALLGIWLIFSLVLSLLYYVRAISKTGQTPGRKILGIQVVNTNTGQPPTFAKSLLRYFFAGWISGSVCYLGYLWMLWDDKNQTWHDKVSSTVVVRA